MLVKNVRICFLNWKNDGREHSWKMLICAENDNIILSFDEMATKWVKSRKLEDFFYSVDTFYVAIDYVGTNYEHRLNELSSDLLQNFFYLEYICRNFSFETWLAFNKICKANIS